jgi:hypothetical protein
LILGTDPDLAAFIPTVPKPSVTTICAASGDLCRGPHNP